MKITYRDKLLKLVCIDKRLTWILYTVDVKGYKRPLKAEIYTLSKTFTAIKDLYNKV